MDICEESDLAQILIAHKGTFKRDLFVGDKLNDDWCRDECLVYSDVLNDIKNNEADFIRLLDRYLTIYDSLTKSELMNSDKSKKNKYGMRINTVKFLEWADKNNQPINDYLKVNDWLRATYGLKQKNTLSNVSVNQSANQISWNFAYHTKELSLLFEASEHFWKNASSEDRDTQVDNPTVAAWLVEKGMDSDRKAKAGATIIRPKWAGKGRIPY